MLRPKDLCQGSGTKTFLDAMHNGKMHLARFVLDALDGRIVNSKTENSRTPLMFAVCLPDAALRTKFTRLLLEKGADVNSQDEHGRTALSLACELGHVDVVKLLVQCNADPEISDSWGNSAIMYAAYAGHSQVLEFLVRAFKRLGLRLDRTNCAGHSAREMADFFGHNLCVQALSVSGKRYPHSEDAPWDSHPGGGSRRPNRLPKQVLERFTRQLQSKCEDHLPAVFQRQLRTTEGDKLQWHPKNLQGDQKSPKKLDFSGAGQREDAFAMKQIQNSKLRPSKTLDCGMEEMGENPKGVVDLLPAWGKAKSFNAEVLSYRKQSYQGEVSSSIKPKRGSLQDENPYMEQAHLDENDGMLAGDSVKGPSSGKRLSLEPHVDRCGAMSSGRTEFPSLSSTSMVGRQDKLLPQRGEMAPESIWARPPVLTGLGTRLLRRFTAPEFMRMVIDFPIGSEHGRGRMSRSETFPQPSTHRKVISQPSVDSISSVKCEFDSTVNLKSKSKSLKAEL